MSGGMVSMAIRALKSLAFAAIAALMTLGCAVQEDLPPMAGESEEMTFTAVFEPETRTSVSADGKVRWEAGDLLSVLDGTNNIKVTLEQSNISSDGRVAVFTASVAKVWTYYAVYPYNASHRIVGTEVSVASPSGTQDGTFASAHVSLGSWTPMNSTFTFSNVTGILRFELEDPAVASVRFEAGSDQVTVATVGDGPYYIGLMPQEYSKGFTLTAFTSLGAVYGTVESTRALKVERSGLVNLGSLDSRLVKPDPAAYVLAQSDYGVYDCVAGSGILVYDEEEDQTGVLAGGAFRLINPNDALWFELSGCPTSLSVGDTFTATVCNSYAVALDAQYQQTLSVRKIDGSKVWLYSEADGRGYIIKR